MAAFYSDDSGLELDALTGLDTLNHVLAKLGSWQEDAVRQGEIAPVHAMLVGLRRFETVNLAYGEAVGDQALVELAARIQRFAGDAFEGGWLAARAGGGSFLIAVREGCSRERWEWLAETLADQLAAPISNGIGRGSLHLWPRVALVRALPKEAPNTMFARLAETLDRLQHQSGQRVFWVDGEITPVGRSSAQLEADLLSAIDRDEIEIVYQPQFATADDRLVGAEALARWQHSKLGPLGAGVLFAMAERTDRLPQLSRHIASRALAGAAEWPGDLRLSLNVTAADLSRSEFARDMSALIDVSGFPARRLTLEITEQSLVSDLERSARQLDRLVNMGIRVALDDFGAGFCNFRYLKLLPLHYLKLDRAMVEGVVSDDKDLAVFRGIVAMAHALDLKVISEGIETEQQRLTVAREGCELYQGFLRAEPMSAAEFATLAAG